MITLNLGKGKQMKKQAQIHASTAESITAPLKPSLALKTIILNKLQYQKLGNYWGWVAAQLSVRHKALSSIPSTSKGEGEAEGEGETRKLTSRI